MSTGISISSINRIKELAEEKKFKEALEILDTQNLDKSINPQFLRISGEIFRENKRYYDSRRILLKAHQMAPQGNRIIYELIQLYLELGYFTKAQKYYEQYMFYTTSDDTQREYVEYIMKKATGEDVKDLAAILIPILEQMPEDRWNFEAVLLYHKIDRKDKALEECRYILENFKESEYVQPVIDYIDDKLDVDKFFCVYPKEEQLEDAELFGDLIEQEEKILEADYLRMYPPEARIMVEAEDKEAIDVAPVKEKKVKKKSRTSKKKDKKEAATKDVKPTEEMKSEKPAEDSIIIEENAADGNTQSKSDDVTEVSESEQETADSREQSDTTTFSNEENIQDEALRKKAEREAALELLLSKKIDKDKIKESAKQVAKAVREIDADKTKQQVKHVAETVRENVKKATDVLGEAVGTKQALESIENAIVETAVSEGAIVDGIIESVLESPKKTVGQVVMNEELDALIPESLEAMSGEEIASIEAKKEEAERLELEALEASLKLEEEKKVKKLVRKAKADNKKENATDELAEEVTDRHEKSDVDTILEEQMVENDTESQPIDESNVSNDQNVGGETIDSIMDCGEDIHDKNDISNGSTYTKLKNRYIDDLKDAEEQPLDSLGFITVVHSDVDVAIEQDAPDAANMLRQMIDNKEFYSGENSLRFESEASYQNHGFEVEDFDFTEYKMQQEDGLSGDKAVSIDKELEHLSVHVIFAQKRVVAFEEILPEKTVFDENILKELHTKELALGENIPQDIVSEENVLEERNIKEKLLEDVKFEKTPYEDGISKDAIAENIILEETLHENTILEELFLDEIILEESVSKEKVSKELIWNGVISENIEAASVEEAQEEMATAVLMELENADVLNADHISTELQDILDTDDVSRKLENTDIFNANDDLTESEIIKKDFVEHKIFEYQESIEEKRQRLRLEIVLSAEMERKLSQLKER